MDGNVGRYIREKKAAHWPLIEIEDSFSGKVLPSNIAEYILKVGIWREFLYHDFRYSKCPKEKL